MDTRFIVAMLIGAFVIGLLIGLQYRHGQVVQLQLGMQGLGLIIQSQGQK